MLAKPNFPQYVYESIDSTQEEARRLLASENRPPFCVLARVQTHGKGRSGRKWQTNAGQYSASFVTPMPANRADAPKLSLVAALALSRSFESLNLPDVAIKWPNDVLVTRRKIAGILLEAEADNLILGIGVNLSGAVSPEILDKRSIPPVSLSEFTKIGFEEFHSVLEFQLAKAIGEFSRFGFEPVRKALKEKLLLRETMVFNDGKCDRLIEAKDIGPNGQLIVDFEGETKEFYAGDLWFEEGK